MQTYGEIIKEARIRNGLSQFELSKKAGVSQSAISKIESGNAFGHQETITKLLDALDVVDSKIVVVDSNPDLNAKTTDFVCLAGKIIPFSDLSLQDRMLIQIICMNNS